MYELRSNCRSVFFGKMGSNPPNPLGGPAMARARILGHPLRVKRTVRIVGPPVLPFSSPKEQGPNSGPLEVAVRIYGPVAIIQEGVKFTVEK